QKRYTEPSYNRQKEPSGNHIPASADADVPDAFRQLQAIYPKRSGSNPWPKALKACRARLREGHTWQQILDGAQRYADFVRATGKERTEYVQQASTFCGPDKHFLGEWERPV